MSADNTIAIFETTDEKYRVAHVQNVEEFGEPFDQERLDYFNGFRLFTHCADAWAYAEELFGDCHYVEYGIQYYRVDVSSTDVSVKKTPNIQVFGDIVEQNGKTIRENNQEVKHKFEVGQTVAYRREDMHLMQTTVTSLDRDCDGTPLYSVKVELNGIGEESLQDWNEWIDQARKILAERKSKE